MNVCVIKSTLEHNTAVLNNKSCVSWQNYFNTTISKMSFQEFICPLIIGIINAVVIMVIDKLFVRLHYGH